MSAELVQRFQPLAELLQRELRRLGQEWREEPEWGAVYEGDVERLREAGVF